MRGNIAQQFISFLGVGVIATTVHYAILIFLVEGVEVGAVTSSSVGAFFGGVTSYILNRRMTFKSDIPHKTAAPKFFIVAVLAFSTNLMLMTLFTLQLGWPYLIAQVITTILIIAITFGLNKYWSFADNA